MILQMDHLIEISDSTEWLDTPLNKLARVDAALRCQVCKDFFESPMITSCNHTFCSLCIRRCLSTEGKCPACRSPDQELKLRNNAAVQELVESFKLARPDVLGFARNAAAAPKVQATPDEFELPVAKKRKVDRLQGEDVVITTEDEVGRRTRSQSRRLDNSVEEEPPVIIEDSEDVDYQPDDGLVACPICNRRMKETMMFDHVGLCPGPQEQKRPLNPMGSLRSNSHTPRNQTSHFGPKLERLPAINFSILKENALRKKFQSLGIPDWGPKHLLQRRYTEWMNLWNANCDSRVSKTKRELLRELDIWENTQGGQAPLSSTYNSIMEKNFDGSAWSATYGDDYKSLIATARKKRDTVVKQDPPPEPVPEAPEVPEDKMEASAVRNEEDTPQGTQTGSTLPEKQNFPPEDGRLNGVNEEITGGKNIEQAQETGDDGNQQPVKDAAT